MSDDQTNSTEVKRGVLDLQKVLVRLPDNPHAENARRALDTVRDHAMRSLETPPDPSRR
jgi:hypothetical protein